MNIELSGTNVLISICLLFICILTIILGFRSIYLLRKGNAALDEVEDSLTNRNKYLRVSALKNVGLNFRIGLICSLSVVLLSFSWTTYDNVDFFEIPNFSDLEIIEEIPRTPNVKPPPPPPPPPPLIEEVPEELIEEEDIPDFKDQDIEDDDIVVDVPISPPTADIAPMPAPLSVVEEDLGINEIIGIAEVRPRFPGCEDLSGTHKEKKACADKKMLEYIYSRLDYPQIAQSNGIEGTVVIQFVVTKEGVVSDINAVRKVGAGCDEAATRIIENMNNLPERWTPGKQRGKNVSVRYTLPIKFKLLK